MTLIAVSVLGIDLLLKEKIGYGTIIDALLTGNFVQLFNSLNPLPLYSNLLLGIGIMLVGFVFMALGMAVYMKSEQCCSPRDALLVGKVLDEENSYWIFSEITANSFKWKNVMISEDGTSTLDCEIYGKRLK